MTILLLQPERITFGYVNLFGEWSKKFQHEEHEAGTKITKGKKEGMNREGHKEHEGGREGREKAIRNPRYAVIPAQAGI